MARRAAATRGAAGRARTGVSRAATERVSGASRRPARPRQIGAIHHLASHQGASRAGQTTPLERSPSTRRLVGPHPDRGKQGPTQTGISGATTDGSPQGPNGAHRPPSERSQGPESVATGSEKSGAQIIVQRDSLHEEACAAAAGQGAAGPRPYESQQDHDQTGARGAQTGQVGPGPTHVTSGGRKVGVQGSAQEGYPQEEAHGATAK